MEFSLRMFYDVNTSTDLASCEGGDHDGENVRKSAACLREADGRSAKRSNDEVEVVTLRGEVNTHPEGVPVPRANGSTQVIVGGEG